MPLYCYLILLLGWLLWVLPFFVKKFRTTPNAPLNAPPTSASSISPSTILDPPSSPSTPQSSPPLIDRRARWGIFFQAISYFLIWQGHFWMQRPAPWRIAASILLLLVADIFCWGSVFALGRQWRIDAGLNADHQLVRSGAYRIVRHPIYASMLFLLLGTGFMITPLWLLAIAVGFMIVGIEIRIRIEERLLTSRFGDQFYAYRRSVFTYLPIPKFSGTEAIAKVCLLVLTAACAMGADDARSPSASPAATRAAATRATATPAADAAPADLARWGAEALADIHASFYMPDKFLYAEQINDGKQPHPAWLWDASMQLGALCAAARVEPEKYLPQVRAYAVALRSYRTTNHGVPGLDVNPPPKNPDRYYDDNAWIAIALLEAYELTRDPKDLSLATDAYNFALSGEDPTTADGGIYWHEDQTKSKNACSSGPAMLAALSLYRITADPKHLATAKRLYAWTRAHLQDTDGLVFDAISIPSGKINAAKYTYNSATLLHTACLLYQITHEKPYLDEAERIARAAESHFIRKEDGLFVGSGKLAVKLIEAYLELYRTNQDDHWRQLVARSLVALHDRRNGAGWYAQDWQGPLLDATKLVRLIDQASPARGYWLMGRREKAAE